MLRTIWVKTKIWSILAVMACGLAVGCGGDDVIDDGMSTNNGASVEDNQVRYGELVEEAAGMVEDGRLQEAKSAIMEAAKIDKTQELRDIRTRTKEDMEAVQERRATEWYRAARNAADPQEKVKYASYALTRSFSKESNTRLAHSLRGGAYLKMKKFDKAADDFNWVLDIDPENHNAHYYLGYTHCQRRSEIGL